MKLSGLARRAIRNASESYACASTDDAAADAYQILRDVVALALSLDDSVTVDCTVLDVIGLSEDDYGSPYDVLDAIDVITPAQLQEAGFALSLLGA
jgi:hypothetical protein